MKFRHVLVSRLNVFYQKKMSEKGFDPENWLLERVEIFKKFCLPSILNQSNKKFQWFFYIDAHTPDQVKEDLEKTFVPYPFIKLLAHHFDSFNITKELRSDIDKYLGKDFDFLISSRVDTDDMLHKDFISNIQESFNEQEFKILNFSRGLVYHIPSGVSSFSNRKGNPFISLVEKRNNGQFVTVFSKSHTDYVSDYAYTEIYLEKPLWCMTVHGLNDSTGFFGKINLIKQPMFKDYFGFNHHKSPNINDVLWFLLRSYRRTFNKLILKIENSLKTIV